MASFARGLDGMKEYEKPSHRDWLSLFFLFFLFFSFSFCDFLREEKIFLNSFVRNIKVKSWVEKFGWLNNTKQINLPTKLEFFKL